MLELKKEYSNKTKGDVIMLIQTRRKSFLVHIAKYKEKETKIVSFLLKILIKLKV